LIGQSRKTREQKAFPVHKATIVARFLAERGFSEDDIDRGLSYAEESQASTVREAFTLAISRIHSDREFSAGMRLDCQDPADASPRTALPLRQGPAE